MAGIEDRVNRCEVEVVQGDRVWYQTFEPAGDDWLAVVLRLGAACAVAVVLIGALAVVTTSAGDDAPAGTFALGALDPETGGSRAGEGGSGDAPQTAAVGADATDRSWDSRAAAAAEPDGDVPRSDAPPTGQAPSEAPTPSETPPPDEAGGSDAGSPVPTAPPTTPPETVPPETVPPETVPPETLPPVPPDTAPEPPTPAPSTTMPEVAGPSDEDPGVPAPPTTGPPDGEPAPEDEEVQVALGDVVTLTVGDGLGLGASIGGTSASLGVDEGGVSLDLGGLPGLGSLGLGSLGAGSP